MGKAVFARRALMVLAGLAGMALATPAVAAPPLWKVSDADSTMYLFGTVHVLRPETQWRTPALEAALNDAGEVWFELDPKRLEDPAQMGRMLPLMMDLPRPLSTKLSPELRARVAEVATSVGANPAQLEPFKPAPAAVILASLALGRSGYSPDSGVDKVLRAAIADRPVREFETVEQQTRFIADMPEEVQIALLETGLEDLADLGRLDKVVDSWAKGDLSAMEELFLTDLMTEHPAAYDIFLRARNTAWTETLDAELKGAGSDFVAVGALHLVGPDGLPTLLAARGYKVERVN